LGTDDFEPSLSLVLDELLGGEPFFQEGSGFGLGFGLGHPQGCQRLETGSRTRLQRMRGMYSDRIYIIAAFVVANIARPLPNDIPPPTSRGMNSTSVAVGSNSVILRDVRDPVFSAAV